ncbi:uncharacterized protein LOC132701461 [Cylas formicarius]|uniref:uncharacterized protein LOC132701461 n=1 Tax=Cylas formicarius TaxID=197179 RepID=UPI002958D305|nr:uncharacterized protein LOC132701461 [Cylas formicarius]
MSKPLINALELIEEVKKRPCLYDFKVAHGNQEVKMNAWGEIGVALFKDRWMNFNLHEKEAVVREMQVKWKSLRDNFSRSLRNKEASDSGPPGAKSKKYIYFDHLSFLAPYYQRRNTSSFVFVEENRDSNDSTTEDVKPITVDPIQLTNQSVQFIHIPSTSSDQFNSSSNNADMPTGKRIAKVMEELAAMQKEERADDPMGNRKFLLSLLPFMKKLPDDVNLEVRLQLMSVLQTYASGKGFL